MRAESTAEKTSGSGDDPGITPPKKGETFRCSACGMEIQVTVDCGCKDGGHVHFHCCGKELDRV